MLEVFKRKLDNNEDRLGVEMIPLRIIAPNPNQPRKYFDNLSLNELTRSIEEYGVLQPITVRRAEQGYELISGERRYRAAVLAGLETIPAIVVEADTETSAVMSLLENLQREDLCFFEIAESYKKLIREQGMTQSELAQSIGKSQSTVAGKMRLLLLPPRVRKMVRDYGLSEQHARMLLNLPGEEQQLEAVRRIGTEQLGLQQTSELIAELISEDQQRKQTVHVSSMKDVRMFTNTVKKALDMMKKNGIDANMEENEADWGIEYIIRVKNKEE